MAGSALRAVSSKVLPESVEQTLFPKMDIQTSLPPASEGGAVIGDVVTTPGGVSQDIVGTPSTVINNIPYGGEFMPQQPPTMQGGTMYGSPRVYAGVSRIAGELARRGGIPGFATGIGVGALGGALIDGSGKPLTIPQMVRATTGQSFTRKTQMAYKNLAEMTGLSNAAACLGIPEQLFCQALIHRFPSRRRGISAAQLRTAKRVNGTIARMHKELSSEFKGATRRSPARRTSSTVIQNS